MYKGIEILKNVEAGFMEKLRKNCENQGHYGENGWGLLMQEDFGCATNFLRHAFLWSDTPEGSGYWADVHEILDNSILSEVAISTGEGVVQCEVVVLTDDLGKKHILYMTPIHQDGYSAEYLYELAEEAGSEFTVMLCDGYVLEMDMVDEEWQEIGQVVLVDSDEDEGLMKTEYGAKFYLSL